MNHVRTPNSLSPKRGKSPGSNKRRSMKKCNMCRQKRVKCMPTIRTWPGQRCISCEEHDLPCGPNVHARHSATTKLRNNPRSSWPVVQDCAESQATVAVKTLRWDGINDFESASSLTDLEAPDWGFSIESTNELVQDCALNLPPQNSQRQTECWAGLTMDLSLNDEALRENKSNMAGSAISATPDDHREIDLGLLRLGKLRVAFEAVESRTRAVASLPYEWGQESVKHALKFISWCIASKHDAILSTVVTLAAKFDAKIAENTLLRALRALEELDCIDSRIGPARESQKKLRITIIHKLFNISTARSDLPEAEHWLGRLAILSSESNDEASAWMASQLAHLFQHTSKMAQAVLDDLELDHDIRDKLHFSKPMSFPAIHRAIRGGHLKAAQILSSVPSAMDESDLIGRRAFHIAAETGTTQIFGFQSSPTAIDRRDTFQYTPVLVAACNGNLELFTHLVKIGADVKARTLDGRSALAVACSAGHVEIVRLLLQEGADPNDNYPGVSSPLRVAATHGYQEICKILIQNGAFTDLIVNPNCSTPTATKSDGLKKISDVILDAANDVTIRAAQGLEDFERCFPAPFDLAPQTTPKESLFSEPDSVSSNSASTDHDITTCRSSHPVICDGLSCTEIGVAELASFQDPSQHLKLFWELEGMDWGTMQYPFDIVDYVEQGLL